METLKTISEAKDSNMIKALVLSKVIHKNIFYFYNIQEKEIIPELKKNIQQIVKNTAYSLAALAAYNALIELFEQKNNDAKKELEFLNLISSEIIAIIKSKDFYSNASRESNIILRIYFLFYSNHEEYYIEGLKFFSKFPELISSQVFNSIKSFLFYFAYQLRNYSTKEVKELLEQNLLNAVIEDNKTYLDFCMYCFYRGLYFIERKDFYMGSYFYCTAVSMGFKGNRNNCKLFNGFNTQMIRSLCLLKFLTKFDVVNELFRGSRFNRNLEDYLLEHQDISICIDFIKEQKTELNDFRTFILQNVNFEKCGLKGLMKAAEEEIMFNTIKEKLKIFKRTRISKISTLTQLDYNDIMKILKKKVLEGEINVKYDESEDIIEVIDADPGLKEKVKKTKDLYEKIMEGNKNMFLNLKNNKFEELNGKPKDNALNIDLIQNRMNGDDDDEIMEYEVYQD